MYLFLWVALIVLARIGVAIPYFKTEPTVESDSVQLVTKPDPSAIAPGYIFVSRFGKGPRGVDIHGWGPEIFDSDGSLVWCGRLDLSVYYAKRLHVCDYAGSRGKHLCFHQSTEDHALWHLGFVTFVDNHYFQVAQFGRTGTMSLDLPEGHELNTPSSCSNCLLQAVFQEKQYNITHKGRTTERTVMDGCFQEVDTRNRSATFEWCALDHLPSSDLKFTLDTHEGKIQKHGPNLDLWHLNGIDRNDEGDYLLSFRLIDAVMKIAGKNSANPGSVLWRLGPTSSYKQDFKFSGQHTARFVNATSDTDTISFFNNAWQNDKDHDKTSNVSAGYLVEVNHKTESARLLRSFNSPEGEISTDRGSMQILPNGNAFVGWGKRPRFTEFSPDGQVVFDATFTRGASQQAWKQEWVGRPYTKPKVVAYALDCSNAPLIGYASWNGATEVRKWRFWGGDTKEFRKDSWRVLDSSKKSGFETKANLAKEFVSYVFVEALDAHGEVLGTSEVVQPFVPNKDLAAHCNRVGCRKPARFDYTDATKSQWKYCRTKVKVKHGGIGIVTSVGLALVVMLVYIETCTWLARLLLNTLVFSSSRTIPDDDELKGVT